MPPIALVYSTTDTPSEDKLLAVDTGLEQHNYAVAPLTEVRPLAAFATDQTGTIVGGAAGRTWGRCCELLQLWVATELRYGGVGSRLLQEFEAHARARGCSIFYLTTLSYRRFSPLARGVGSAKYGPVPRAQWLRSEFSTVRAVGRKSPGLSGGTALNQACDSAH